MTTSRPISSHEVLDTQLPEIRDVLLRTSIVDVLTPELVEALTGLPRGRHILDFLARGNQFIERAVVRWPNLLPLPAALPRVPARATGLREPELPPELSEIAADLAQSHRSEETLDTAVAGPVEAVAAGSAFRLSLTLLEALRASLDSELHASLAASVDGARHPHSLDPGLVQPISRTKASVIELRHYFDETARAAPRRAHRGGAGSCRLANAALAQTSRDPRLSLPLETQAMDWLSLSARSAESGDAATALIDLERALELMAPKQLRAPLRAASRGIRRTMTTGADPTERKTWLMSAPPLAGKDRRRSRTSELAAMRDHRFRRRPDRQPLTVREREVLNHLAALLTTPEIAATMFVSINTVRTHIRSILRKMGASRRNEAVRRAWELGLLRQSAETGS